MKMNVRMLQSPLTIWCVDAFNKMVDDILQVELDMRESTGQTPEIARETMKRMILYNINSDCPPAGNA